MKVLKVIGKIFAILFCVFYYFGLNVLMILSFASALLSGDYYSDIIKDVDLKTIKVSDLGEIFQGNDFDPNSSIEDVLVSYITASDVDEETAMAIIEDEEIADILGIYIGKYVNYQLSGEKPVINRSDVETVLNNPNVIKVTKTNPTSENVDKIYNQLNDFVEEMVEGGSKEYDNSKRTEINIINY